MHRLVVNWAPVMLATERSLVGGGCAGADAACLHHVRHLLVGAPRAVCRAKSSTQVSLQPQSGSD
eukprot:6175347-Pleurochrysis_carterae.AAC.1